MTYFKPKSFWQWFRLAFVTVGLIVATLLVFTTVCKSQAVQDNPLTIRVVIPGADTTAPGFWDKLACQSLKIGGNSFFELTLFVADKPEGPRLGGFDLPGGLHFYLNIKARLFFVTLVYGHVEFT